MPGQEQFSSKTLLVQEEVTNNIGAVSLLGRAVVELTAHNAVALASTALTLSSAIDVSLYKSIILEVVNSLDNVAHDVAPEVRLYANAGTVPIGNGDGTLAKCTLAYASYPLSYRFQITKAQIPALESIFLSTIKIGVKATVTPTTGSITVIVKGVPN